MKRIGIMTTGGDCSGLNTVLERVVSGATQRGWEVIGIRDGTDGLYSRPVMSVKLTPETLPIELARLSGSYLCNGRDGVMNFESAAACGKLDEFKQTLRAGLRSLELDTLIIVGGNGSLSLAWNNHDIYADVNLVCIPKTIDMDVPLTDNTVGFDTAVQQLVEFGDQILLTARSHHRWFVIQAMGRDVGSLALHAGVALGVDAILIPEIKFDMDTLVERVKNHWRDYGIIMVSEGVSVRGHSGQPADIISRALKAAGITNRALFPEHIQRAGDTVATDRILAASMADSALRAIENKETYVMTAMQDGACKTVALSEFFANGSILCDPHISGQQVSNAYVSPDDPLLTVAANMGTYIGETK